MWKNKCKLSPHWCRWVCNGSTDWNTTNRRSEENSAFNAIFGDDPNSAHSSRTSVVVHGVKHGFLHKLNTLFLGHILSIVLANVSVDVRASRASNSASLTDQHTTQWHWENLTSVHVIVPSHNNSSSNWVAIIVTKLAKLCGSFRNLSFLSVLIPKRDKSLK